jgi:hypothetical protein
MVSLSNRIGSKSYSTNFNMRSLKYIGSWKSIQSQYISAVAMAKAQYSTSVEDRDTTNYFFPHQEIIHDPK